MIQSATVPRNGVASDTDHSLNAQLDRLSVRLSQLSSNSANYATQFVAQLLEFADAIGTSDVHLQPTLGELEVKFRFDGVLQHLGEFPTGVTSSIVSRLKVLSNLLTYRNDIPQEGRIALPGEAAEVRVSTFPTLYGERAVLRFFGRGKNLKRLEDLGHSSNVTQSLYETLAETSGAMLVTGPAGSGKSTTLFACLRELAHSSGGNRSLLTIEDPIEVPLIGVSQSQVNVPAGFDLHTGLRSLLRQDPEVIMIGEIRDPLTAEIAIQACLTGQLMLTTYHADSTATAITRLLDMGIEPYLLRSGVIGILSQRLLRKVCQCATMSTNEKDFFGLPLNSCLNPQGCVTCNMTGYIGRVVASEFLSLKDSSLADQVLDTRDSRSIYRIATANGMKSIWENATDLVRNGTTSPAEVRRVLGLSMRI